MHVRLIHRKGSPSDHNLKYEKRQYFCLQIWAVIPSEVGSVWHRLHSSEEFFLSKLLGPAFPVPTPPIKKQSQVRWAGHVDVKRLLERTCSYGPQECTYNVATGGLPVSKDYNDNKSCILAQMRRSVQKTDSWGVITKLMTHYFTLKTINFLAKYRAHPLLIKCG